YNALLWLEKLADYQEGLAEPMQLGNMLPERSVITAVLRQVLSALCDSFWVFSGLLQSCCSYAFCAVFCGLLFDQFQ
ncbi:hypothetical protein O5559_29365, partial [Escherichia coli]|nr:hypothetical protein [Escherichia coli]